ncbi:ATP-dependent DNA helicase [Lichenicola cladoniae]|uniref:ATP-dependent DNA helicase n=1 Tax=Lichenicola cladoniae TaxID=1484109 RepID=A0A6M8HQX8_9PROT|nr:ATP-dependent DNA helicase [Lichenicola cladoniae]NPD68115.1 ATP-dependent DNA helicase [Acetobacteraceae bacterium]QKE90686.1 ATP-dependent DNA helicase [Lichenicola cladoniae]
MHDADSPATIPALVAGYGRVSLLTPDGELLTLTRAEGAAAVRDMPPPLVVHAPANAKRLGLPGLAAYDLLELFAFVMPARSAAPTPRGLALALGLEPDEIGDADASLLPELASMLLERASQLDHTASGPEIRALVLRMRQAGWSWGPVLCERLGIGTMLPPEAMQPVDAMRVWRRLPKWEETAPRPAPGQREVAPQEARARLTTLLGPDAEQRVGQADYADAAAAAFAPRLMRGDPRLVLAEAGTGTGKTLGYVAPASLWAERNGGTVWISTYTRHLQRQIETELKRLHPDAATRRRKVVLRKGRENYLCLLNLEEAVNATAANSRGAAPSSIIPLSLLVRWAGSTTDGDVAGGDLPGWFAELFGHGTTAGLADRRGECIHGACPHYTRCYIEHGIRRARDADLVVANHALVMAQAAWHSRFGDTADEDAVPTRYVFDEGHHLMEAADSAFSAELSGLEAAELRRWLLGAEGSRSRARGLRRRLDELVVGQPDLETPMETALMAARALPAPGWSMRMSDETRPLLQGPETLDAGIAEASNPTEALLHLLRQQVLARAGTRGEAFGAMECDLQPVSEELGEAASRLERALVRIAEPLTTLVNRLLAKLEEEADTLDTATRGRIEAATRTIRRRAISRLEAWIAMLRAVSEPDAADDNSVGPRSHVMFLRLEKRFAGPRNAQGNQGAGERDVGLHRHWLDPTLPFAAAVAAPAHGLLVTSATLRDEPGAGQFGAQEDADEAWASAEARVGATHLPSPALRAALASPFDYARQTRALIVTDVAHDDIGALAAAYRALFLASGGGGLGLFTAISRLRQVHERLAVPLEEAGIPLFAQHMDAMDNATLVDVFRTEQDSCLLGTDAMRDGVDVPGRALRLVVFERVPWPRPDILHRERRIHLSGGAPTAYDDRIARLRLRQAFGRLIRTATDQGVFVLLDRRTPTRLFSAFPNGVVARRVGLAEAVAETREFLSAQALTHAQVR